MAAQRASEAGYSLVEVMVALFIIALASGFAIMTLPPRLDPVETEARVFAAKLNEASDQAVVWGVSVGAIVDADGYRFYRRGRLGWEPIADDPALKPKTWTGPTSVALDAPRLSARILRQLERRDGVVVPLVRFDPVGQANPIEVRLQFEAADYAVRVSDDGAVSLERLDGGFGFGG